jgi:predicted O-linked N-acetylglucosamine transferase (SPINDLY family)
MSDAEVNHALRLGHAHLSKGRLDEAESAYRQVLSGAPNHPAATHFLGAVALRRGHLDVAIELMRRSVAAAPREVTFLVNLGVALVAARRFAEAIDVQTRAIALQGPRPLPDTYTSLGNCYYELERVAEAEAAYRKEVALHPDNGVGWCNLGVTLSETGRMTEAVACYRRAIALEPDEPRLWDSLLSLLPCDPGSDADAIRVEHRRWAERFAARLGRAFQPHANDRTPGRRLRVGYVSPNLRTHVVGRSLLPILEHHDRGRFEVFCYSDDRHPDDMTQRLRAHADLWRETFLLDDAQLAHQVRGDGIDVLVDLAVHMGGNRLLAFARRPAPVQVTYVGYAGTTGLPAMDWRITDVHMDPPGAAADGPEDLLRLSNCYWAYRPADAAPQVLPGALPCAANGFVTFGSFNNFRKVSEPVLAAWAGVLNGVPGSMLIVTLLGGETNTHLLDTLERFGVSRGRVRLLPRQRAADYFRLYARVDVSLDPFPYNGGITGLDSLWMGVPFVTLAGDRAVGRAGLSLLTNVGLTDLVTHSVDDYVARNVALARDTGRLAGLRSTLRGRLQQSPLMDEVRFTRDFERLLSEAWERWRSAPAAVG